MALLPRLFFVTTAPELVEFINHIATFLGIPQCECNTDKVLK